MHSQCTVVGLLPRIVQLKVTMLADGCHGNTCQPYSYTWLPWSLHRCGLDCSMKCRRSCVSQTTGVHQMCTGVETSAQRWVSCHERISNEWHEYFEFCFDCTNWDPRNAKESTPPQSVAVVTGFTLTCGLLYVVKVHRHSSLPIPYSLFPSCHSWFMVSRVISACVNDFLFELPY